MANNTSKPKPNGPQGGAKKATPPSPRKGGTPTTREPKDSTLTKPAKAPGSGTRGKGNKATPPKG